MALRVTLRPTVPAHLGKSKRSKTLPATSGQCQAPRTGKWLPGIPEWEAMKGSRRDLSHAAAVRECAHLTTQYRRMSTAMANVILH